MAALSEANALPTAVARLYEERDAIRADEAARTVSPGALSPRERVDLLVDESTWLELAPLARSQHPSAAAGTPADGLIAGWARVAGIEVGVLVEDPVALERTDAQVAANKRLRILNSCAVKGAPVVYLADGAGTQPVFAAASGDLFGFIGRQWPEPAPSQRKSPTVTLVFGRCRGRAAEIAATSDVVIATPQARFGEEDSPVDNEASRDLVHRVAPDDVTAITMAREVFAARLEKAEAPTPSRECPPSRPFSDDVGAAPSIEDLVAGLFDGDSIDARRSASFATGTARLASHQVSFVVTAGGTTIGVEELAGIQSAARTSHDTQIPLLLLQDSEGYDRSLTGNAEFLRALGVTIDSLRTTLQPKLCVVTGAGHVLGTFVLGGRQLGMDVIVAMPWAQVAPLDVPWYVPGSQPAAAREGPWLAAGLGHVDEVLAPSELHDFLAVMLTVLSHGRDLPPPEQQRAGRYIDDISKV